MRALRPAELDVERVLDACLPGVRDAALSARIESLRPDLVSAEAAFLTAAGAGAHRSLPPEPIVPTVKEDMKWFYEQRLVESVPGFDLYGKILKTTVNGMCPFCGIARANTLDHGLPKAAYPRLAVTPANLVPACRECNLDKNDRVGIGNLSPYFDSWATTERWLTASVPDVGRPDQLEFQVRRVAGWSAIEQAAVDAYFDSGKLDERFATLAVDEFLTFRASFQERMDDWGVHALKADLESRERDYARHRLNGWQAATYAAWHDIADFVPAWM